MPAYGRFPSCQFVAVQNRYFLIDCGEGAQMQLARFQLPVHRLSCIFISHLHGDHYLGLMGLLFSLHLQRRTEDLHIFSIRGLDDIIQLHLRHAQSVLSYRLRFVELNPNQSSVVWEDEALEVIAFPLRHKLPTCGFSIREKAKPLRIDKGRLLPGMKLQHIAQLKAGKDVIEEGVLMYRANDFTLPPHRAFSYGYFSDTRPLDQMPELVAQVDVMYHEATFLESERSKATETAHSTAKDAARLAVSAGASRLLLGHFSARYRTLDALLAEAQEIFPATQLAIEGSSFEISDIHESLSA